MHGMRGKPTRDVTPTGMSIRDRLARRNSRPKRGDGEKRHRREDDAGSTWDELTGDAEPRCRRL